MSANANIDAPSRRRVALRWALVGAWAAFIFFMSAHTGGQLGSGLLGAVWDALANALNAVLGLAGLHAQDPVSPFCHFCEYAVMGALATNALRSHLPFPQAALLGIALASGYGATDELHQLFVPGRACDPVDWLVDTAGAALGTAIRWAAERKRARPETPR